MAAVAVSANVLPFILVASTANFFKFNIYNIYKNNISKMFEFFFLNNSGLPTSMILANLVRKF